MKHRERLAQFEQTDKRAYAMCKSKRKFKSSEASKVAMYMNQRKYECPICGHWHLTRAK